MSEGDQGQWVSYLELAAMLNVSASAARMHAVRRGWQRRSPNAIGGRAMVLVPDSAVVQPRSTHTQRTFDAHMPEPNGPDQPNLRALEVAITALSKQLDRAEGRIDELQAALADALAAERIASGQAAALQAEADAHRSQGLLRRLAQALKRP
jgi:hypothetical protein